MYVLIIQSDGNIVGNMIHIIPSTDSLILNIKFIIDTSIS